MGDQVSVSESVIDAVATAEDTSPVALPPLHGVIETDAVDALFATGPGSDSDSPVELCFHYSNSIVTIDGDRTIDVAPRQPLLESTATGDLSD